jgi:nucleoid-associated protein YgaU
MGMKHLALAVFVGFGLSACSGDDEQAEPVQAEEGTEGLSETPLADGDAAASPEGEAVADAELTVPAEGEAPKEDAFSTAEGEAPPSEGDETAAMYSEPPMPSDEAVSAVTDPNANPSGPTGGLEPEPDLATSGNGSVQSPGAKWSPKGAQGGAADKVGTYTVRLGDTLAGISHKLYGSPSHYTKLAEANGLKPPYLLFPGQTISYTGSSWSGDDKNDNGNVAAAPGATKTLTVRAGDTLWHLAEKHLGNPYAWRMFVDWNPGVLSNPNRIEPGMKLAYGTLHGSTAAAGNSSGKSSKKSASKKKSSVSGGSTAFKVSAPKSQVAPVAVKPVEPVTEPAKKEAKLEEPPKPEKEAAAASPDDAPPVEETVNDEAPPPPPAEEVYEEEEAE